ncbi:MAG TPA: SIS domain-containing protein [Acidimicrobiales bacterium]|nr:SIS domain-containing protein [Acidimicrobiales bacterium]
MSGTRTSSVLEREIRSQPAMLEERGPAGAEAAARAVAHFRAHGTEHLLVAARGSSGNAARFGQYLLADRLRLLVSLATPSVFTRPGRAPRLEQMGVIGLSQSGQSPDVVSVLAASRAQARPTVAVTNDEGSPLALAADLIVPLAAGEERAVAATKTYLASLVAFVELADAYDPGGVIPWAARLPALVHETVDRGFAAGDATGTLAAAPSLSVVGRGLGYSAAMEAALKMREVNGILAEGWSAPDLLHGPIAGLQGHSAVLLVTTPDFAPAYWRGIAEQVLARTADLVVISDDRDLCGVGRFGVRLPIGPAPWISSALAVVAAQALTVLTGRCLGVDVDRPDGISKVTRTR